MSIFGPNSRVVGVLSKTSLGPPMLTSIGILAHCWLLFFCCGCLQMLCPFPLATFLLSSASTVVVPSFSLSFQISSICAAYICIQHSDVGNYLNIRFLTILLQRTNPCLCVLQCRYIFFFSLFVLLAPSVLIYSGFAYECMGFPLSNPCPYICTSFLRSVIFLIMCLFFPLPYLVGHLYYGFMFIYLHVNFLGLFMEKECC